MKLVTLTFLLALAGHLTASAQSRDTIHWIDGLFSHWNNATPGASVAISRNGKIIYKKAFGLADLEHLAPNTTETIFECGSVSKQFTAMSILLLAKDGWLNLQDDVRKHVPELPSYDKPIRIQHLLNHTSGLKDWGTIGALAGWPRTTRVYTQDLALQIICKQQSLNFTPGSEYSYSNTNYSLLVTILERVSGMSLEEFTRIRFFEPLNMKSTRWRSNFQQIISGRAVAYAATRDGYEQQMPFENIYGHGGLLTTTSDLLKWNALLENYTIGGGDVFKQRIKKGTLNNGKEINYAAGLFIGKVNGHDEIQHSGATAGYRGWLAYYPQTKLSITLLSNDGSFQPAAVGLQLAEIFLGKSATRKEPAMALVQPEDLKRFKGTYRSIRHFDAITLTYIDGRLRASNHNIEKEKDVKPLHRDTLYLDGQRWVYLTPDLIMATDATDTLRYARVAPPNTDPTKLKALEGTYWSDEAEVAFEIKLSGNQLWAQRKPTQSFPLHASFHDGFFSDTSQLFEFLRNNQGVVTVLLVSQSRAERVRFVKTSKDK